MVVPALLSLVVGVVAGAQVARPAPPDDAHPGREVVGPATDQDRAAWDRRLTQMRRAGTLRLLEERPDPRVANRRHQQFIQLYKGVVVASSTMWRQLDGANATAIEGVLFRDIAIDPVPKLTTGEATEAFRKLAGGGPGPSLRPELVVLPLEGKYLLAFRARLFLPAEVVLQYVDAHTGQPVAAVSEMGQPPGRR